MPRLTPRGMGVVALTIAAIVGAFSLGFPELLGLAAGAIVALAVAFFLVSGGGIVSATVSAPPRVERLAQAWVIVRLEAHRAHARGLRLRSPSGVCAPVLWDAFGVRAEVPIPTRRRGPVLLGPWTIERVDPWGLLRRNVGSAPESMLLVVPRIRPVSLAALPSALTDYGGSAEMGTTTFATLREYVVGDELRHVHWRSSAKSGKLMMRQYVDVTRPRIMLILVTDPRAYAGTEDFEDGVDYVASLAAVAASSGLDVDVVTTAGERAAHGTGRSSAAIDMLANVEAVVSPPDSRLMRGNRSTTLVITGQGSSGWWSRIPAVAEVRP